MNRYYLIFTLTLLLIVGCLSLKTDTFLYDELINKAKEDFKKNEFSKALDNFENAFNIAPYRNKKDYFYAASAAFHIKNNQKATEFIISSIKNMDVYENNLFDFNEFQPFINNDFFNDIKYQFPNLIKKEIEFVRKYPAIDKELDSLIALDQKVRKGVLNRIKDQKIEDAIDINKIKRVDSLNVNRIIEIAKEYGWHPRMQIILWHQRGIHYDDNYVWNYFRPFINEQIEKGVIEKSFWTRYEDEKSISEKGTQIYGTYKQFEQFPIEDIKNLDIRRKAMGLPPLWYYNLIYKNKLVKEYKEI